MAKPRTAAGYDARQVANVRAACLYLATKLGDFLDEVVIVGGFVPSLLIDQTQRGVERHVGTLDLDVGMQVAILDNRRYAALTERLREADFAPDVNEQGNQLRQTWRIENPKVTLDFLIPPSREGDRGGALRDIEADFAAIIAPGLPLAFRDAVKLSVEGRTIRGEEARREINVCGPGAFVAMKALALRIRGANKDAYDISYFVRNFGEGPKEIAQRLRPLLDDAAAQAAVGYLREDFASVDHVGPRRAAEFLYDSRHEETQADAWGAVRDLLEALPR